MLVYTKKVIKFINEVKNNIKFILNHHCQLKVSGDRFYDKENRFSYPIKVVIFNNKSMLGYFDPSFYELAFHECLMLSSKEQLGDIIKHEIAHYLSFIKHGPQIMPHGTEFKTICMDFGWGENVYRATTCLDDGHCVTLINESSVFRKIQKLMALSASSNQFEAEQAMIKSQQLLLKHNIDAKYALENDEEKIYLKRIMKQKKETAKMRAIARILETFFVNIVFRRCEGFICLEILGSEVNLEIAEYVAGILDKEFEKLWEQAKKYANLKGAIAKNSFFIGIAKGYCEKIHFLKKEYSSEITNALMVIEKKLQEAKDMVYSRLRSSRSNGSFCSNSSALGEMMGRQLNINPAIRNKANASTELLMFHK